MFSITDALFVLLSGGGGSGIVPRGTRVDVFQSIYWVFIVLGTAVGVVVIGYMTYNAYKYRDDGTEDDKDRPTLGERPQGGGGGRKLFLSFALSTIIVVSLIAWTYGTLLYVEQNPATETEDALEVTVVGYQFGWDFVYPNGNTTDTLRLPADRAVQIHVTSRDVFHNFGIPALRVKTDAIPGHTTTTWLEASETGTYTAKCYELCGSGHSYMTADVKVMEPEAYANWYANTTAENTSVGINADEGNSTENESGGSHSLSNEVVAA
jgi:cytochrome c oxidase subunit 2